MSLKDKLMADMKIAMKSGDKDRLLVIRSLRAAVRQTEIDGKKELDDDGVIAVASKELKMRQDSLAEFKKGGREDLVQKTQSEIDVIIDYLPKQLTEEEIRTLVSESIAEAGASTAKDMGKIMKVLMPKVKGKANGKVVNNIVREMLK